MSSGPPNGPIGPPPEGYQISAPSSTWDDWLIQRPEPSESGSVSFGDVVATLLRHGMPRAIDFANPSMRDGMRQLFDEFEVATTGQWITTRDDTQSRGAVVPWFDLKAEAADGQVSLSFRQTGDFAADYRLSASQALDLVKALMHALDQIAPGTTE